ncbi:aliphatic sulfonate ABC transporter substrate-binding protein [Devosia oryziradicis]|uniref:Aliphatic sulfonate ABC transporter substrate-binding protein n=1 Tax=Devosia oryziradicis TaxID=2801335 RepID=A0ABX7BSK6_9HYPH|nr:aliphatic sulfonate ABC transporter substrate-binding protein [Devosia oryziradicis]QQR34928.1 aliphatic sulfonate ABC transporter substrate-binding protein [Devosia oryziradicis]
MFTRRQTFQLFAGAAAVLGLPSLARAQDTAKEFRIGWQKGGVFALAKNSGALEARLAARGVTVSWAEFTSGPPLLEALGAHAIDFGSTGDVPPLFAHAAGGDLVYVAATPGSLDGSAILVKQDSPVQTIADLKGKRVAFKRGSSSHNFIVKALRTVGLTLDDITPLDLGPPDAAPAFANNQIDAWVIWDPYYAIAAQDPDTRVLATTEGIVDSYGFYQANGAYAKENPTILAEVIDELRKVGTAAQTDLDATAAAISASTGVPTDITRITLGRKAADLGAILPLDAEIIAYQQALADEFYDLKIIPRQLNVADAVWQAPAI